MVSRRNLVIIVIMFFVLFCLFEVPLILKESGNHFDKNDYAEELVASGKDAWSMRKEANVNDLPADIPYVVYLGDETSEVYYTAYQWANYRKMNMVSSSLLAYQLEEEKLPAMILIDGEKLGTQEELDQLTWLEHVNVPIVFCSIPDVSHLKENPRYMNLLGIDEVIMDEVEVDGIHAFSNVFLGGELVYESHEEMEIDPMDLNVKLPLYHVFNGAKTYIVGMYKKTPEQTEMQPALLWRYSNGANQIYVVNGDYIQKLSGMGYLNAIYSDSKSYDIYPIVNAQVLSLVNFPPITEENSETIYEKYSRSMQNLYENLVWPNLISSFQQSGFYPTAYLTMGDCKKEDKLMAQDNLFFYLKQFKEQKMEAGLSLYGKQQEDAETYQERYDSFMKEMHLSYKYSSLFVKDEMLNDVTENYLNKAEDVKTIVSNGNLHDGLFGYVAEDVTFQNVLFDATDFYYSDDMELVGYETAVGYSNTYIDFTRVTWPEEKADEWQNFSKRFASTIGSYWKKYDYFDYVTASEADARIRSFLSLHYAEEKTDDEIHLTRYGVDGQSWFILKLHNAKIDEMDGGQYKDIGEGFYLLTIDKDEVMIKTKSNQKALYIHE